MHIVMTTSGKTRQSQPKAAGGWRLQLRQTGRFESAAGAHHDLEPKDALLLAYLAIEGSTSRGRLAALLWPDVGDERARGNLRQRLLRLKRTTGAELVTGNPQARLAGGGGHDLEDSHELLAGIEPEQAGGLAEWLETQRERRRLVRAAALAAALAQAQAAGDHALALGHANGLVELDPWSEEAHRQLMRLHYLRGDVGAAMAAYERCARLLRAELGAVPSRETIQLRSQIEKLPAEPVAASPRTVPVTVLRPPRLIGRDGDWAALQAAWETGDVAVVLGEAGLGKTRLVTDFARARGQVAVVCARAGDERAVYALATRLLRQLPRDAMAGLDAAVRTELARLLPEYGDAAPLQSEAERTRFCNAVGAALASPPTSGSRAWSSTTCTSPTRPVSS